MKQLSKFSRFWVCKLALLACLGAQAQTSVRQVQVPIVGTKCNERVPDVSHLTGELRLPPPANSPIPAVVIMHSNAGVIGVGRRYAQALNMAGVATLEIDSYGPRQIRSGNEVNAPTACDRLNDAWSALNHLAQISSLDPQKIGILGLSSGGLVALMAAQGILARGMNPTQGLLAQGIHFRGAFVLYPACANIRHDPKLSWARQPHIPRVAVDPKPAITLVVGTEDDYELNMEEDCNAVVTDLAQLGHSAQLITRPGATHAFDWPTPPPPSHNRFTRAGQGGLLTMRFSEKDTQQTQSEMIRFFTEKLWRTP